MPQQPDTSIISSDSVRAIADTIKIDPVSKTVQQNSLLNSKGTPAALDVQPRNLHSEDALFYLLVGMVLLLAFFRFFFARYFSNLFRVFFNTSLRQSQLTDQLLQARLPALFFNIFFIVSAGLYSYFLLAHYGWLSMSHYWIFTGICIAIMAIVYLVKYSTLKFTGWITGYSGETNIYIFILFLVNKILGIFLVPFTILIAFADPKLVNTIVPVSLTIIGLMLFMRFFRSYGLLQNQLKVSRFHLLLYILGIEILPLLLIYKGLVFLLNKNL
jgi:hypothetical protein